MLLNRQTEVAQSERVAHNIRGRLHQLEVHTVVRLAWA